MNTQQFIKALREQIKDNRRILEMISLRLQDAPKGSLNICKHRKGVALYRNIGGKKECLSKKKELASKLAQKEYDERVVHFLEKRLLNFERFERTLIPQIEEVYCSLSLERQKLVTPLAGDIERIVADWYEANPGNQNPYPKEATYLTERGEMVRSKSEKIIADILNKYGIPYIYEPKLLLRDGNVFYPDFLLFSKAERKTIAYEHFGMVGELEYGNAMARKINRYSSNGWWFGDNLLYSLESATSPLDINAVVRMIERFVL